ncbi:exosortase/archaeosortase family protein [Luteolibacter yonseiensis]|uniref:Exosortase/archaeosortase family protein n=1 Tax=Luteolibacter yonseiensis TaxID=1144680 RepID=A0A934RAF4_9BACT|nr:exosortase/archaeosortase family protein [Luteolibacter yonseiensis]MBK1817969.1 exosortase/archaeosortase family protein [Luteolibacter yonseiensis]
MASNDPTTPSAPPIWEKFRWILPILVVVLLSRFSVAKDGFSQLSRPVVLWLIDLFGGQATDHGDTITVGRLDVPWSGDCAGLNLLVLLLAVAVWMNRREPMGKRYWVRIFMMIPAAAIANVLRIFMIIGYREVFYPAIESPQLHYFFGLALLVPFALLAMPKSTRSFSSRVFELLHVAAVIALLAPHADGSQGAALTIAVILGLSNCHMPERLSPARLASFALWVVAAGAIAFAGMESFWLPWVLVCPLVCDPKWLFSPVGALVTLSSHRMVYLIPGAEWVEWVVWAILGYAVWTKFGTHENDTTAHPSTNSWNRPEKAMMFATAVLFLLPFLSSTILAGKKENWVPPTSASLSEVPGGQMVTLPGQNDKIGLLWYDSVGTERHHKLEICLKYRGVELTRSKDVADVFDDGKNHWMKEYYLQNGKLIQSHQEYVISTLGPGTSAGVHLILITDQSSMSAKEFSEEAGKISSRLYEMIREEKLLPGDTSKATASK